MTNNNIVEQARSWIGVKFKHQGRLKSGCDCLGLIMNLEIICKNGKKLKYYDETNYPKIQLSNHLMEKLDLLLHQVDNNNIKPGNIVLLQVNDLTQHLAVISQISPLISIIHSYAQVRSVVEQTLPTYWKIARTYKSN